MAGGQEGSELGGRRLGTHAGGMESAFCNQQFERGPNPQLVRLTGSQRRWGQDGGPVQLQQGEVVVARVLEGPTRVQPHLLHPPRLVLCCAPAEVCHGEVYIG